VITDLEELSPFPAFLRPRDKNKDRERFAQTAGLA
jgi:hypothetical protein